MDNVLKKTAKALCLFLLFAGISCFLGANQTVAFQEGFSSKNLTYEETFENGDAWKGDSYAYQQLAGSHSFKSIKSPTFQEYFSGKFELRYGDPMVTKNGGPRSEVLFPAQSHRERWYSFAVFFPSYGWKLDKDDEVVSQWHTNNGTPPLCLRVKNGNLRLRIGHIEGSSRKFSYIEFGKVPKDDWNEFVFHVIHSEKSDGLVEVWKNGEKLATHKGPNLYEGDKIPRWKLGIYKSNWSKKSTDVNLRVTYFDNVRVGSEKASLTDMVSSKPKPSSPISVSGISITPNTISLQKDRKIQITAKISPSDADNKTVNWSSSNSGVVFVDQNGLIIGIQPGTAKITAKTQEGRFTSSCSINVTSDSQPLSINNFSLIDASTNSSIQTLADGDILDYNQLKNLILNFRVHTVPETLGSVAISLSGPAQSSRTDNGFSYDLLNNDGLRLPEGNYTLTAVPYSERENGGTKGAALSIQFALADANTVIIPDCPVPTSPTNGSNGVISSVNLEWTESEGSETYSILVAEDEGFHSNFITLENFSGNRAEIKNLEAAKSYFWKVKANNQNGSSTFSEPWSFLTNREAPEMLAVTGLAVGPSSLTLEQGSTSTLEATISPSDAHNKKVSWSSSNSTVATVNENGLVTAVGQGTANITATTDDGGFKAVSKVTVSAKETELAVQNFTMVDAASNKVISKIADGDRLDFNQIKDLSINFRASTFPEKSGSVGFSLEGPISSSRTDNGFTYDLLSNKGLGLLEGEYTLTATPYSLREKGGYKGAPLSIRFSVAQVLIPVSGVTINHSSLNLEQGSTSTLEATVSPSRAHNNMVSWSSSNSSVATVDKNGLVTAVGQGTANITATTDDGGFKAVSKVTVSAEEDQPTVQSFALVDATSNTVISKIADGDRLDYSQIRNMSINFRANTFPEKIGSVDFSLEGPVSSSRTDNGFAYELLYHKGLGLLEGEYTLTATPYSLKEKGGDKGAPLSIRFSVSAPKPVLPGTPQPVSPAEESSGLPSEVVLDWNQVDLADAYEVQVADNSNFTDPVVDQQNINGSEWKTSGLEEETRYFWRIRATAEAGQSNWSDPWMFETERKPAEEIPQTAMHITIVLEVGNTLALSTMVTDSDSNHKSIIWSSSDERIVVVNTGGKVTALIPGEAIITAKTSEGELSSSTTIIVKEVEKAFAIESFQMINTTSNSVIHTLSDGEEIDIHQAGDLDLNFRAIASSPKIKSVFISLTGPVNSSRTDNGFQYELLSNKGLKLSSGNYTLTAIPYTERDKGGQKGEAYSLRFTVSGEEQRKLDNAPDLISPSNGDMVDPTSLQFFWIDNTGADQYEVEVSRFFDFSESDMIKSGSIKVNHLELAGLEYAKEYHWRVRARKDGEWGAFSSIWKFQTEQNPTMDLENPVLVSPGLGEIIHQAEVSLTWKAVEQANHYKVYISSDKDFIENVMEYDNLLDTVLKVSGLELDRAYYWKVESGSAHERRLSDIWDFRTEAPAMTAGLREGEAPLSVSMFPNPSQDIVNLELGSGTDGLIQVTLSGLDGNTVFSKMMENHEGLTTLNLSNIKPGIYLVSILANRQSKVMKLIKK